MIYGKKYAVKWTPQLKAMLICIPIGCAIIGMLLGFTIGRLTVKKVDVKNAMENISPVSNTTDYSPLTSGTTSEYISATTVYTTITDDCVGSYYNCPLDCALQDYIAMICDDREIPMSLILGMIEIESNFKSDVISTTNDYGLMQINVINHEWLTEKYGITNFLDSYQNVYCGITMIADLYDRYQDIDKALMAYNCGATGAKRLWDRGVTTTAYVEKVKGAMAKYE